MMNTPLSSTGQLARYLVAGPLVLAVALGFSAARAQGAGPVLPVRATAAATSAPRLVRHEGNTAYYVDGHRTDMQTVSMEVYQNVATLKVLNGAQVRQVFGDAEAATRVIVIVTNRYRDRADVVALDQRVDAAGALDTYFKMGPAVDPTTHQLPDGIKTYIAKTYPNAKITGWFITDKDSGKSPHIRYFASLDDGGQKRRLYFNAEEQPVTPAAKAEAGQNLGAAARTELVAPGNGTAPVGPQPNRPAIYYLDGERQDNPAFASTAIPANVASIDVIKDERAQKLLGADAGQAVAIVTTKANQHRADVVAFNRNIGVGVPPATSAADAASAPPVAYLAAPALAYITKNHPEARLLGVTVIKSTDGGTPRYRAEIAEGRRPRFLVFDAQGQLIP